MKHAIMILAHKNIGQICRLVEYFKHDCDVFVHIDRKQTITQSDKERLLGFQQVKLISQEYEVYWGGTSVLESELHLLRLSVQHSDADYFHLISGQDYPTRSLDYFLDFFERKSGKEFINYLHLPHPNWQDNTFRRLQYYYPLVMANYDSNGRATTATDNYESGLAYIDSQLQQKKPVIVAVDYKEKTSLGSGKKDQAGDHFVIIVGGSQTHGYHYYDPATASIERGTSSDNTFRLDGKLLKDENRCTGSSKVKYYTLTSIRMNK